MNPSAAFFIEESIRKGLAQFSDTGALVVQTGKHTGRAAQDKFVVRDSSTENTVNWGKVNQPCDPATFSALKRKMETHLAKSTVYTIEASVGASRDFAIPVTVKTTVPWQGLFSLNMFRDAKDAAHSGQAPITILHAPEFEALPDMDKTRSNTFILVDFASRTVLIGGTFYAGEVKKSAFTMANYYYPEKGALPMHCSANVGSAGDVSLFFGLSGTGKTTLSADPHRLLIGDDEHGWDNDGVFNLEGGCYAKLINLSAEQEPEIFAASNQFGAIMENVDLNPQTRAVDYASDKITENTRSSYPLNHLTRLQPAGKGGHPNNVIFLTADAFGVLPPVARLTPAQASYYFISGYTAKVAGTEMGVKEPTAAFSTCFGAPFMPLHPTVYGTLLAEKIRKHNCSVWLVNTGWMGGAYGTGKRISLKATRAILHGIQSGVLNEATFRKDTHFGFEVPTSCPNVDSELLNPAKLWKNDADYQAQAKMLVAKFRENFKQYDGKVSAEVAAAGPIA